MTTPFSSGFSWRFVLALMVWPVTSHATDWDIDQLMRGLAQTRSSHTRFVETKTIAMLDEPVESSGELFYSAPDRFEKRTLKPRRETLLVDGDTLLIERGRKKYRLQLQDYPELAAFIDSIRGTLAGDRRALERNYQLGLDGNAARWTLQLLPTTKKMQAVVKHIRIAGARNEVSSVEVTQTDGDSSLMRVENLATP